MSELDKALRYFAETYHAAVVGIDWDEACDYAESVANRFRYNGPDTSDRATAEYLYCEACRYANM